MNDPTKRSYLRPEITPRWDQYIWAVRYADAGGDFDFALFSAKLDADLFCETLNGAYGAQFEVVGVKR